MRKLRANKKRKSKQIKYSIFKNKLILLSQSLWQVKNKNNLQMNKKVIRSSKTINNRIKAI